MIRRRASLARRRMTHTRVLRDCEAEIAGDMIFLPRGLNVFLSSRDLERLLGLGVVEVVESAKPAAVIQKGSPG